MGTVLPGVIAFVIAVWATCGQRGFALAVIRADVEDDRVPARRPSGSRRVPRAGKSAGHPGLNPCATRRAGTGPGSRATSRSPTTAPDGVDAVRRRRTSEPPSVSAPADTKSRGRGTCDPTVIGLHWVRVQARDAFCPSFSTRRANRSPSLLSQRWASSLPGPRSGGDAAHHQPTDVPCSSESDRGVVLTGHSRIARARNDVRVPHSEP